MWLRALSDHHGNSHSRRVETNPWLAHTVSQNICKECGILDEIIIARSATDSHNVKGRECLFTRRLHPWLFLILILPLPGLCCQCVWSESPSLHVSQPSCPSSACCPAEPAADLTDDDGPEPSWFHQHSRAGCLGVSVWRHNHPTDRARLQGHPTATEFSRAVGHVAWQHCSACPPAVWRPAHVLKGSPSVSTEMVVLFFDDHPGLDTKKCCQFWIVSSYSVALWWVHVLSGWTSYRHGNLTGSSCYYGWG